MAGSVSFQRCDPHSADYKNGEPYRGQKVLVVGFGNSGTEIAMDLWEHGSSPTLSVRSPVNIVSRDILGIPVQLLSALLKPLPVTLIEMLNAPFVRLKFGNLHRYGLRRLSYGAATQIRRYSSIPVIDVGVVSYIRKGHIAIRPGIEKFTEQGVTFTNGISEAYDAVILATGYHTSLDRLLTADDHLLNEHGYPLSSGYATSMPGLYFCGFYNSNAGMLYEIAREAKRITGEIARSLADKSLAANTTFVGENKK